MAPAGKSEMDVDLQRELTHRLCACSDRKQQCRALFAAFHPTPPAAGVPSATGFAVALGRFIAWDFDATLFAFAP
jgi:hypothetical protein